MWFANPILLAAGLAAVALPVVIHVLFRRKRRPMRWAAMRFLEEAYRQQRRRTRLEQVLLLLARCLAVALIALAVGHPVLGGGASGSGSRTVYVVIDNSLASQAEDGAGRPVLAGLLERASAVVGELDAMRGDRAAVVLAGGPVGPLVLPASADLGAVRAAIQSVEATDGAADLARAMGLVARAIAEERAAGDEPGAGGRPVDAEVVVVSELRAGSADLSSPAVTGPGSAGGAGLPGGVRVRALKPAATAVPNVGIARVTPARGVIVEARHSGASGSAGAGGVADAGSSVEVALVRSGEDTAGRLTRVRAYIDGADGTRAANAAAESVVRWAAGQREAIVRLGLAGGLAGGVAGGSAGAAGGDGRAGPSVGVALSARSGERLVRVEIDRDALPGDGRRVAPVTVRPAIRIGLVAPGRFEAPRGVAEFRPEDWLRAALRPSESGGGIELTQIEPAGVDLARLTPLDAIVLPRPDLLTPEAWRAVGERRRAGLGVVVFAPAGEDDGAWARAMSAALNLSSAGSAAGVPSGALVPGARGASSDDEGLKLVPGAAGEGEAAQLTATAGGGLLGLLGSELEELLRGVSVTRWVSISMGEGGGRALTPVLGVSVGGAVMVVAEDAGAGWGVGEGAVEAGAGDGAGGASGGGPERGVSGAGVVVISGLAWDLGWTDLPAKPLAVPLIQEVVRQAVARSRGARVLEAGRAASWPAGAVDAVELAGDGAAGSEGGRRVSRAAGSGLMVERAGSYALRDARGGVLDVVAVNTDARASDLSVQPEEAVAAWLAGGAGSGAGSGVSWLETGAGGAAGAGEAGGVGGGGPGAASRAVSDATAGRPGREGPSWGWLMFVAGAMLLVADAVLGRRASYAEAGRGAAGRSSSALSGGPSGGPSASGGRAGVTA